MLTVTTNGLAGLLGATWLGVSALRTLRWSDLRRLKRRRHAAPHVRLAIGKPPSHDSTGGH